MSGLAYVLEVPVYAVYSPLCLPQISLRDGCFPAASSLVDKISSPRDQLYVALRPLFSQYILIVAGVDTVMLFHHSMIEFNGLDTRCMGQSSRRSSPAQSLRAAALPASN